MDAEKMKYIVEMVMKKLQSSQEFHKKKALVILEGWAEELSMLEDIKHWGKGYDITLLVLKTIAIHDTYEAYGKVIYIDSATSRVNKLLSQYDTIILPSPSLKSISMISHLILDGVIPELVFQALEEGKAVLVCDNCYNKKIQRLPPPVKIEAEKLMSKITSYGITKVNFTTNISNQAIDKSAKEVIRKKVITVRDLEDARSQGLELIANKNTIITPLAAEFIREKKVNLKTVE